MFFMLEEKKGNKATIMDSSLEDHANILYFLTSLVTDLDHTTNIYCSPAVADLHNNLKSMCQIDWIITSRKWKIVVSDMHN